MNVDSDRFSDLINDSLGERGRATLQPGKTHVVLKVGDKIVQALYYPDRGEIVLSTAVFLRARSNPAAPYEVVSAFNHSGLLSSGICMLAMPDTESLYVCQAVSLARLDRRAFRAALRTFLTRAAASARLCLEMM